MTLEEHERPPDAAMATLLANHRRFLDFLTVRVGNRDDAEEILQEAFVRGAHKAADIRDEESAVAWFFRLLRNAVVDHYRRTAAGRKALEAHAQELRFGDPGFNADLERTVCECINDLIPQLRPEYSDLIRRVDLGGTDIKTAAADVGISPGNARVRLHRARAALRDELERTCRVCATHGCVDCTCSSRGPAASQ